MPSPPSKAPATSRTAESKDNEKAKNQPKPLEEDDEFEDFPVEDWSDRETEASNGKGKDLWEESWDDNDTNEDFSAQLKEELKRAPRGGSMS